MIQPKEELAKVITRPSTLRGAPYGMVFFGSLLSYFFWLWTGGTMQGAFYAIVFYACFHGLMAILTKDEPRLFDILAVRVNTIRVNFMNRFIWGGNSYETR